MYMCSLDVMRDAQMAITMQVHLEWLERDEALKMEPQLHCVAALWSPNTAIVDSHRCC